MQHDNLFEGGTVEAKEVSDELDLRQMEDLLSSLSVSQSVSKHNPRKRTRKQFEATDSEHSEEPRQNQGGETMP